MQEQKKIHFIRRLPDQSVDLGEIISAFRAEIINHDKKQPYIEGWAAKLLSERNQHTSASFGIALEDITQPRTFSISDSFPKGEIRDAGVHEHLGARHLIAYVGKKSMLAAPCFAEPELDGFEEGVDFLVRDKTFEIKNGGTQKGCVVYFGAQQIIEMNYPAGVAHGYDAVGSETFLYSLHPNEYQELRALKRQQEVVSFQDESPFLVLPKSLSQEDCRELQNICAQLASKHPRIHTKITTSLEGLDIAALLQQVNQYGGK